MQADPMNPVCTTALPPSWVHKLTAQDFHALGLDASAGASCVDAITAIALADNVDLKNVTACLDLLRSGPVLLHIGAPLALMSYSPTVQRFKAMYDGTYDDAAAMMTEARAGLWLTLLASEVGALPTRQGDWGLISVRRGGADAIQLESPDTEAVKLYQANVTADSSASNPEDSYHLHIRNAVFTCIKHAIGDR